MGATPIGPVDSRVPLVLALDAVDRTALPVAGGKGANLGELIRAGFPVPSGFVVTTAAYRLLLDHLDLAQRIPVLLDADPGGASVRQAIETAPMPSGLAEALSRAYRELGAGPVAVRSSATAEDLPEAAFAGQQETYLNVVGEDALLDAVHRCWASLWTERAIAYRGHRRIAVDAARIAVVVQQMAPAEFAGVLFTANPVTGARDEVVVDASAGLGEAVVSGRVTPDHFVLDKRRRRLKRVERGRQEVVVRAVAGGGTQEVAGSADDGLLPARALRRLVRLAVAIEQHFGCPQDVEWAWASARPYILQARPITALPEPPPRASRVQRMAAGIMSEILPIRPYPLDVTTATGAMLGALLSAFRYAGIRFPPIDRILVEEDGVVVRLEPPRPRPTPMVLLTPAKLLRLAVRHDPRRWETDPQLTRVIAHVRALQQRDLEPLAWEELHATMREALTVAPEIFDLRLRYLPRPALAIAFVRLLLGVLGQKDQMASLFSTDDLKTTEINRALEALAAQIRADPELREIFVSHDPAELVAAIQYRPFAATLLAFLDRYGNRETVSPALATQPTWSAAPQVVLGMLKGFAATPPPPRGRPAARAVRAELLLHPLVRRPPLRALTVRALDLVPWFVRLREDTRFYVTLPLPVIRRVMLEFGQRLTASGALDTAEDVFHLRLEEIERAVPPSDQVRPLVQRRKEKRASLADTPLVDPRLLTVGGPAVGDALLTGAPGSPGVAEGPARIIHNAYQFDRLRPGDVLVAPYTHPAWTPLFQRAAAVVVDSGGAASHAAIVAREYGIPAVMGTGAGTQRLSDGQPIGVDGDRGVVLPARRGEGDDGKQPRSLWQGPPSAAHQA
jgi:rifampicin phosphotransferase